VPLDPELRWRLYRGLARWPLVTAVLRARKYDKLAFLREVLGLRLEKEILERMRGGRDVCWVEDDTQTEPLITIAIPTYARADLVVERAIKSAISQMYENIEILVVGDRCTDQVETAVRKVCDPRLRFVNLGYRGIYPENPRHRWQVVSTKPINVAIDLARGAWITGCDDDDELMPDHVSVLLAEAKRRRLEMVFSRAQQLRMQGGREVQERLIGSEPLRFGAVSRGTVLYSMGLRFMHADPDCWRIRDVHDWNLWKRMQLIGVRIGFCPEVTFRHFPSGDMQFRADEDQDG